MGTPSRKTTSRELVDAILHLLRAGAAWRLLSDDLPFGSSRRRYPFVTGVFADGGYAGRPVE